MARRFALGVLAAFALSLVLAFSIYSTVTRRRQKNGSSGEINSPASASHNYDVDESLICHVELTLMSLNSGGHEEGLECMVVSNKEDSKISAMSIVSIDLPPEFLNDHRRELDAGMLYVRIPGGYVKEEYVDGFGAIGASVHIPADSDITVLNDTEISALKYHRRREMERDVGGTLGTRSVMVFRITTDDASPVVGATEIEERIFSTTSFSFAKIFKDCSFQELQFQPFDEQTLVTELYVPGKVSSFTERTILNAATKVVTDLQGPDFFDRLDHAIFCMPTGTSGKPYIAYSGVGSFFSVYHDSRCAFPTTVAHEVSHNLGLGHAFENGEEYGDETTIMGFSSSSKTGPKKCFNGQNIFHFGWFQSRSVMVDPFQGHQIKQLASFVDYDITNDNQSVLITVFDMHLVYNRAKGFNEETTEYPDTVTIAREQDGINSELLAKMNMDNPTFTLVNILGTGRTLVIEICDLVVGVDEADYVSISIGLDYSVCPEPAYPTSSPTPLPTSRPSRQPTISWPTYSPVAHTSAPTYVPNTMRTVAPSAPLNEGQAFVVLVPPEDSLLTEAPDVLFVPQDQGNVSSENINFGPTVPPTLTVNAVNSSRITKEPDPAAVIFAAVTLTVLVCCSALFAWRWNIRRLDEQRRNLRILQCNASSQVKLYMQDPV